MILLHCLAAPIGAALEWIWLDNELTARQILCGVVILAGVAIALAPGEHPSSPREHLHLPRRALILGILFGVIAAFGQGVGSVVSRKAYEVTTAAGEHIDGITAAYQRIWGGVLFAAIGYFLFRHRENTRKPFLERMRPAWKWMLANGTLGPALGVSFMQYALSKAPTGIVLPILVLAPVVIIPFSRHFENERPTLRSLIGGLLAVAGVIGLRFSLK
jgi:drug/metabolite transporter (DMT)-like permease